jgi:trk system potassium uptake protein TrkA
MRIFIVGAGQVGLHIAKSLSGEGHDLVVVERDAAKVNDLHSSLDVLAIRGDGCDPEILRSRGIQGADLFFAVSNDDAANLLSALTAKKLGAARCVVRVGAQYHGANPLLRAEPDVVPLYPEKLVAEEILGLTRVPGVSKVRYFHDRKLVMLQARPSTRANIYDRPLKDLEGPEGWILTGISRAGALIIPSGKTVLRPGEPVYAVGLTETIGQFLDSIGVSSRPTRKVVVAGAGQVGTWLAGMLVDERIEVTVVQRSERRAFQMAASVPEALVLRGDATDPSMLREAGTGEADYFVAATQDDETNILSSLLARELGARSIVTLYNRPEFLSVLKAVRIDLPLSPRMMIAGTILRMVHRREILSLDLVEGGDAEVVEFEIRPKARVLKRQLKDLDFPRDSIVGAVVRGEEVLVPRGTFQFQKGDRCLVFTRSESLPQLESIFRGKG